jgi:U4/U6.U5 tri-snRNP-associated protein 1
MDLSIEEANKIRVAMGMAPLPVPGGAPAGPTFKAPKKDGDDDGPSTLETRQAASYDNWKKVQAEAEAKAKREAQKEAIKKAREKAARFAKLEGKGLAEIDDDLDDKAWLMQSKKRQKKVEKTLKLQEQLEEEERQAALARQYTESDLAGVKVGHELDAFGEGEDQILVLKDTAVDADEDDELEAVALKEKERLQEKLDSKKRKRVYDPNDMDEDGKGSILAQYDEEIDGKKRKAFTLDGQGRTVEEVELLRSGASKPKKVAFNLDILKDETPANDYMDVSEIKVKKPKKKKAKSSKKRHTDDDGDIFPTVTNGTVENGAMDIDEPKAVAPRPKKVVIDESLVDDDDLQAKLAAQRQAALKKRKKVSPQDLARLMREEASATPDVVDTIEESEEPGLIIDETTEFVTSLEKGAGQEQHERRSSKTPARAVSTGAGSVDEQGDVQMGQAEDADKARTRSISAEVTTTTGLDEEVTVGGGVASTLRLLRERGLIEGSSTDDLNAHYRQRQKFLADKRKAEEAADRIAKLQREKDRESGRLAHLTPREREAYAQRANAARDQQESRRLADIFNREYKPNVQLNYVDDHGRNMSQKEAFKQLSHQFHGKGSGNQKTQKHLDKIAAEKKRMAEASLDSSKQLGMSNAQGVQSKKNKQAGVRLQ